MGINCAFCGKEIDPFSKAASNAHVLAPVEGKYVYKCMDCYKSRKE